MTDNSNAKTRKNSNKIYISDANKRKLTATQKASSVNLARRPRQRGREKSRESWLPWKTATTNLC